MKSMYRKGYFLGILDRIRLDIFCTAPDPSFNATANRGHSFSCALSLYHETDLKNVANGARSGPGMNIPDHISERLKTIFWVKNFLNPLMRLPIRDQEYFWPWILDKKIRIRDYQPGSATLPSAVVFTILWYELCFSLPYLLFFCVMTVYYTLSAKFWSSTWRNESLIKL